MEREREWSQGELKQHLIGMGWKESDFVDGETLPQGVKFISNAPLTEAEIKWAKQQIADNPQWCKGSR